MKIAVPPDDAPYVQLVREAARTADSRIIENASEDHAIVIIQCLLDQARKRHEQVRIVSGCLLRPFYELLVEHARQALEKVTIGIVVGCSQEELQGNPFYELVNEHPNGSVRLVPRVRDEVSHFVVTGDSRFRVEVDDKNRSAVACFNDSVLGKMLVGIYNGLLAEPQPAPANAVA